MFDAVVSFKGCQWGRLYDSPRVDHPVWMGYGARVYIDVLASGESSHRNIFRLTGLLCGEVIGHQWISHTKASDAGWIFLWSTPDSWANNGDADDLRHHCAHYDLTLMFKMWVSAYSRPRNNKPRSKNDGKIHFSGLSMYLFFISTTGQQRLKSGPELFAFVNTRVSLGIIGHNETTKF